MLQDDKRTHHGDNVFVRKNIQAMTKKKMNMVNYDHKVIVISTNM